MQISGAWQGYPGVPTGTARQDAEYTVANNRVPDPSLNVNYNVDRTIIPTLADERDGPPAPAGPEIPEPLESDRRAIREEVRVSHGENAGSVRHLRPVELEHRACDSVLATVETFGSTLDRPTAILQGRLLAIGAQLNF